MAEAKSQVHIVPVGFADACAFSELRGTEGVQRTLWEAAA